MLRLVTGNFRLGRVAFSIFSRNQLFFRKIRWPDCINLGEVVGANPTDPLVSTYVKVPLSVVAMGESQAEFVRLLTRHSSQIYGFILMLSVNRNDAEDVFQDTSVLLWEKFATYEKGTNFRAWACTVAYYQVLSHRRAKGRLRSLSDAAFDALATDALAVVEEDDIRKEALAECLEKLAARDRRLLEQKYFVPLSTAEIAEQSSKSTYSVYRALSRIHSNLLQCMRRAMAS